jgi:fructose-1-phosphate kinase PfkB-like protein
VIVAGGGVGVDVASAVNHAGGTVQTIGFAGLGILPTVDVTHLFVRASFLA